VSSLHDGTAFGTNLQVFCPHPRSGGRMTMEAGHLFAEMATKSKSGWQRGLKQCQLHHAGRKRRHQCCIQVSVLGFRRRMARIGVSGNLQNCRRSRRRSAATTYVNGLTLRPHLLRSAGPTSSLLTCTRKGRRWAAEFGFGTCARRSAVCLLTRTNCMLPFGKILSRLTVLAGQLT
jgi:hypothetical protein